MLGLKKIRKAAKMTQEKLAAKMDVGRSTISMWETDTCQPDNDTVIKLASIFGVTTDAILGFESDKTDTHTSGKGVKIPVVGKVQAGIPVEAIEDIIDYEEITPEMAQTGEFFALKIRGESMMPRMCDGDIVIVRQQSDVDSGDIAVVLVNGDSATVKKLIKYKNGISLVPFNPAFEPIFYTCEEIETKPVSVQGKVVELRGKF